MYRMISFFSVMTGIFLLAGCSAALPDPDVQISAPRVSPGIRAKRAKEFREAIGRFPVRSVELAPEWLPVEEQYTNEQILAIIRDFGFNRICIYISKPESLGKDRMDDFVIAARRAGFAVDMMLRQSDFVYNYRGNAVVRVFIPESLSIPDMAGRIARFNRSLPDDAKLSGLIVAIDPHEFLKTNNMRPKNYLFSWDEKSYGPGLDNDLMMRHAVNMLLEVCNIASPLPVTASIADFYHERACEGKLTVGKIQDFLEFSPRVVVRNSGNKPSEALKNLEGELRDMPRRESVIVDFGLATHASISKDRYRRRNWADLMRGLNYLSENWGKYPAMGGLIVGPLRVLVHLQWEE